MVREHSARRRAVARLGLPLALIMPVLLTGCIKLGSKPPAKLLVLAAPAPTAEAAMITAAPGTTVTVLDPETPRKLDTVRIPVQVDETTVAYVKDAQWVDRPRALFRQLLARTLAADGTVLVMEPGQYPVDGGRRVMGQLIDFGIDARTHQAIVTYEATISTGNGGTIVRRSFTASAPIGKIEAATVAGPLGDAARQVARDAAAWIKGG